MPQTVTRVGFKGSEGASMLCLGAFLIMLIFSCKDNWESHEGPEQGWIKATEIFALWPKSRQTGGGTISV